MFIRENLQSIPFTLSALCVGGAAVLLGATGAAAHVEFFEGSTLPPPREEVLFNAPGLVLSGTTVQGATNQTGGLIDFIGTEPLEATASGQARISAQDGGFTSLTVDPVGDFTFTGLGFNLFAADDGEVTITALLSGGGTESATFDLSGNGQNRFHLIATDGQLVSSVQIQTTVDLEDIRQVRINGLVIPEPGSLALVGIGSLLALRRRRNR